MARQDELISILWSSPEHLGAGELARRLRVSQPTLSRMIAVAGDNVLRLGRARTTRYTLPRDIPGAGRRWPLYRIGPDAVPQPLGELRALRGEGFHFEPSSPMPSLRGEFAQGVFPGLPWFLDDQRPQGFLGRAFARAHADALDAPVDVLRWNGDMVVRALLRQSENLAGDLVLGERALERALRFVLQPEDAIDLAGRDARYAALADAAMRGELPGSSAAGERPKFVATLMEGDAPRSVIVKFSEPAGSPAARRWADLLHCEALASHVLREHGIAAAEESIVEAEGRTFLQSTRFDRTPALGRRGFVSLSALDAAHYGLGLDDWSRHAAALERDRWIVPADAHRLRVLAAFGGLIANTDMHPGNVAFEFADAPPYALCPAYDMLPMRYAPAASGEVVPREYELTPPRPETLDAWREAAGIASSFWECAGRANEISVGFRDIAAQAGEVLAKARARFG